MTFRRFAVGVLTPVVYCSVLVTTLAGQGPNQNQANTKKTGQHLFEKETFGGNGRTCLTCHSRKTGTVSPQDAQDRLAADPQDPLFVGDGSDDGNGNGVTRMLADATVLINIPLPPNVRLADSTDRFVTLRRGIPTTLNTPALDPVLMLDGRQATLELQAAGAMNDHAHFANPTLPDLELIKQFQLSDTFFSSHALRDWSKGGPRPILPQGKTASEKRGRVFFEDVPPDPAAGFRPGLCAHCHSGVLMNQISEFAPMFFGVPVRTGTRFQNVLVSFFNVANNPVREFIFNEGTPAEAHILSPDPGRALITGVLDGPTTFENTEAFKISQLRGIRHTAPYFHDNSAKTLEEVAAHYTRFFKFVTGECCGFPPAISLTPQDEADIVAFLKLLD
jgi:hypothetical protein